MAKLGFLVAFCVCCAVPGVSQENGVTAAQQLSNDREGVLFDSAFAGKPVEVRRVPKKLVDSLQRADAFWYANAAPPKKQKQQEPAATTGIIRQPWFRTLLWLIVLSGFIGMVLWYLLASDIFIFRKQAKKIGRKDLPEAEGDNVLSHRFPAEIDAATTTGQYRLAVRLWYLHTLQELAKRRFIDYGYGRTNHDYAQQLRQHPCYQQFFRLTRHFEYTWYGQFDPPLATYEQISNEFIDFHKSLPQ